MSQRDQETLTAPRRRPTTYQEKTTPCEGCGWPISERHHMLEFSAYGENDETLLICKTCHGLLHIAVSAFVYRKKRAYKLWSHIVRSVGDDEQRVVWAKNRMQTTLDRKLYEQVGKYLDEA